MPAALEISKPASEYKMGNPEVVPPHLDNVMIPPSFDDDCSSQSEEPPRMVAQCTKCTTVGYQQRTGSDVRYITRTPSFLESWNARSQRPASMKEERFPLKLSSLVKVRSLDQQKNLANYYKLKERDEWNLGKGSYGTVFSTTCNYSGQVRAIKIVEKGRVEKICRLQREILIMRELDHPGIIRVIEVLEDDYYLYLVMEICTGGELFERVLKYKRFTERYVSRLVREILSVLFYIHRRDIVHRDLKPENILFIDETPLSHIKIIDWGFASHCENHHHLSSIVGTPYYIAPEVLAGDYGVKCDMWSLGVVAFICITGYPPFLGNDNREILRKVRSGYYSLDSRSWRNKSRQCIQFVNLLLEYDPCKRLSAEAALNHEWIQYFDHLETQQIRGRLVDQGHITFKLATEIYLRFKTFVMLNPVKRLAVTATAYLISGRDLGYSTMIFNCLDRNRDGVLEVQDIVKCLERYRYHPNETEPIIRALDMSGNGSIDYTEFLAATIDSFLYTSEQFARITFQLLARNRDNLSVAQLVTLMGSQNNQNDMIHKIEDAIKNYVDNDGLLTFHGYHRLLQELEPRPNIVKGLSSQYRSHPVPCPSVLIQT